MPRFALVLTVFASFFLMNKAEAGRLVTPPLFAAGPNNQNVCVAINVGAQPISVTVEVIGLTTQDSQTCTMMPNNLDDSCQSFVSDFAFCRVNTGFDQTETSTVVRAVMMNRSTAPPFTISVAVEAR